MPDNNDREEKLKAALAELGSRKADVADSLRKRRIKGVRENVHACPIARYLCKRFRLPVGCVAADTALIYISNCQYGVVCSIKTPHPIRAFMNDFDGGRHDYLEGKLL